MGIGDRLKTMRAKQEAGDTRRAEEKAKAEAERAKTEAEAAKSEKRGELQAEREAVNVELAKAGSVASDASEVVADAEAFAAEMGENLDPEAAVEIDTIKAEADEAKQQLEKLKAEIVRIDDELEALEGVEEEVSEQVEEIEEVVEEQQNKKGVAKARKLLSTSRLGTKASAGLGGGALEMNYSKSYEDRAEFDHRATEMVKDGGKTEEFLDLYQSDDAIAEEYPQDSLDELQIEMAKLVRPNTDKIDSIAADWALGRDYDQFMGDWEKKVEDGANTSEIASQLTEILTGVEGEIEGVVDQVDQLNDAVGLTVALGSSGHVGDVNTNPSQKALLKRKSTLLKMKRMIDVFLPEKAGAAEESSE
jgi:hypothetical protein